MVVNPGLPLRKERNTSKWVFLTILLICFFILIFSVLFLRWHSNTTVVERNFSVMNDTALKILSHSVSSAVSSMGSSAISTYISLNSRINSLSSSSKQSSSISSMILYILNASQSSQQSLVTTSEITTTTLNLDYTSYSIKVPMKFKYCNPISIKLDNETIIPPDTCLAINSSCCPCSTIGIVNGVKKEIAWGGKIDAINSKYYHEFFTKYLHSCTGFGVKCLMASTGSGCKWTAACVGGLCKLVSRT